MNLQPQTFSSVHDYLDTIFEGVTPSKEAIIGAKKEYWRAYNTDLKRRKRKAFPTFQISFSKEDITIVRSKLQNGQSVSKYIHELVLRHLKDGTDLTPKVNTALIEQQMFLIAEYLRELLDVDDIDTEKIKQLETYIKVLEIVIQESL